MLKRWYAVEVIARSTHIADKHLAHNYRQCWTLNLTDLGMHASWYDSISLASCLISHVWHVPPCWLANAPVYLSRATLHLHVLSIPRFRSRSVSHRISRHKVSPHYPTITLASCGARISIQWCFAYVVVSTVRQPNVLQCD
jgi:hypothetical protein